METTFVLFNIKHELYLTTRNDGGFGMTQSWHDCIQYSSVEEAEYELTRNIDELRRYNLKDWQIKKYYIL